jgi:hypothetical protein
MSANPSIWEIKRDDLKSERRPLIGDFERRPRDVSLALKIKAIDDEIAECTEHIRRANRLV